MVGLIADPIPEHLPVQKDPVLWHADGPPVSSLYDDPYYSLHDGLAETRHVFLGGNDLPARLCDGFHVAELGFGTGLNALAVWAAWRATGQTGTVHFTSFEAHPMPAADMARALAAWPELDLLAQQLVAVRENGSRQADFGDFALTIVEGDATATLPTWTGQADAWFLDGFSPAKNPALWTPDLMAQVAAHTRAGGTAATYSAAGHVRRGLEQAGFAVSRAPGFSGKRHMTRARL